MNTGQQQQPKYSNCYLCNELIGENPRTIKMSIGFGNFYSMESLIIHEECYNDNDLIRELIRLLENPTI